MLVRTTLGLFCLIVAAAHLGCATKVAGGCASDADCAAGEVCDTASNRCVPGGDGATRPTPDGAGTDAPPPDGLPTPDAPSDATADEIPPECDLDGDGVRGAQCGGDDCDEDNAAVHPGATERCNLADEDCDDVVDEECDDDGDGFCDAQQDPEHCDDCCDATAEARPGQTKYFTDPTACGDFDYNCDGTEEVAETATAGTCSCSSGTCWGNPVTWWVGTPPACGATGNLRVCAGSCPCPDLDIGTQPCR